MSNEKNQERGGFADRGIGPRATVAGTQDSGAEVTSGRAYYNENDRFAAQWLRNLIAAEHIPAGDVDERDIREVQPADLARYRQCHFFAGIAGWALALSVAGWPQEREVWTGSCPCQPFSAAGQRKGAADERHLWPEFRRLIAECSPPVVFGEQVASKDGREWLAGVRADLEAMGYGLGAADLCAASQGAPHIRQRLFWVADANQERHDGRGARCTGRVEPAYGSVPGGLADASSPRRFGALGRPEGEARNETRVFLPSEHGTTGGLGDPYGERKDTFRGISPGAGTLSARNPWAGAEWLACLDGKARRTQPGIFPLAHGVPARVGRLRGYGNAIVPQVAAEFIGAFLEVAGPAIGDRP